MGTDKTLKQDAINHLNIILSNTPKDAGFIELRTFSDKDRGAGHQYFLPTNADEEQIISAVKWCEIESKSGRGVFVGYNPRSVQAGNKSDIKQYSAAYADLDLEKKGIPVEAALAKINEAPTRPDVVLHSGGGLHVIHFFEPTEDYAKWTALQRALADHYADVGADNAIVTDSARVLRLAPFDNQKQEVPRPTRIVEFNAKDRKPSFKAMSEMFGANMGLIISQNTHLPDEIQAGGAAEYNGRNDMLFREASGLRKKGYNKSEILALLLALNENRCKPPLSDDEVESIAHQAAKYVAEGEVVIISDESIEALGKPYGVFRNILFPPIQSVIFGLSAGEWGLLQAKSNIGKTSLCLNMAMSAAAGREFAPLITEGAPKRVMILDFENRASFLQMDLAKMARNFDDEEQSLIEQNMLFLVDEEIDGHLLNLSVEAHFSAVIKRAKAFNPEIIIIDTLAAGFTLANENDNSEMKRVVIDPLKTLAKATNAVVLLVHHIGKSGENNETSKLYRGRGASSLPSDARLILDIDSLKDGDKKAIKGFIVLHCAKVKGVAFDDVTFQLDFDRRWFDMSDGSVSAQTLVASAQERVWLLVNRVMTRKEIEEAVEQAGMSVSVSTLKRYLGLGVQAGILIQEQYGKYRPSDGLLVKMGLPPVGVGDFDDSFDHDQQEFIETLEEVLEKTEVDEADQIVTRLDEVLESRPEKKSNVVSFKGKVKVAVADDVTGEFAEVAHG